MMRRGDTCDVFVEAMRIVLEICRADPRELKAICHQALAMIESIEP